MVFRYGNMCSDGCRHAVMRHVLCIVCTDVDVWSGICACALCLICMFVHVCDCVLWGVCMISCAQAWIHGGDHTSARFLFQHVSCTMLRYSDLKRAFLCSELMPLHENAKELETMLCFMGLGESLSELSLSAVKKAGFLLGVQTLAAGPEDGSPGLPTCAFCPHAQPPWLATSLNK